MLSIRLRRGGSKKKPTYRVIVTEKSRDPLGTYLEGLGNYNPHTKATVLNADRIKYWISKGAQPTPTVHNLLVAEKVIEAEKVRASKSKPGKKKQAELDAKKAEDGAKKDEAPAEAEKTEDTKDEAKAEAPTEESASAEALADKKPAEAVKEEKTEDKVEVVKEESASTEAPADKKPEEEKKESAK